MTVKNLKILYFSPTGTTKKIVHAVASAIQYQTLEVIDFTPGKTRENARTSFDGGNLFIIGAPVYYGRIPAQVSDYLGKIHVHKVYAVLVVVYGNREYEDSLKELFDNACKSGFIPIACAAFIGEHSYSSEELPMAHGRPDKMDLEKAKLFGAAIQREFDFLTSPDNIRKLRVPGSNGYKDRTMPKYPVAPGILKERCTLCKFCLEVCPVDAIIMDNQSNLCTDVNKCILCFACVKKCPTRARGIAGPRWSQAMEQLHQKCLQRKEPKFFKPGYISDVFNFGSRVF